MLLAISYRAIDGKDLISALKAIKVGEDYTEEYDFYQNSSIKIPAFIPGGGYKAMKILDIFIRVYSPIAFKDSSLISKSEDLESKIGNQSYES